MGRPKRPWFRFYCEALHDRKLRRLKPAHRWLWVAVLACARQSPVPGHLLINEREPVTVDDLADDAAMKPAEVKAGMDQIVKLGMVDVDDGTGAWRVTKWNERQYESDQSADRMQRHREGSSGVTTTSQTPSQGDHNDANVTSRARGPAGADTEADADAENHPPTPDLSPQGMTVDEAFEKWWATYPQRNGKKVGKGNARTEFRKLTWEQRRRAYWGAVNLAKSDTLPKDPERFLRKSSKGGEFPFDDWQQPGDPPSNGAGPKLTGLAEVF